MVKLVRSLTLLACLAFVVGTTSSMAQEKKTPKKPADTKKADDKPAAKSGSVEIYKNDKGRWRYKVLNSEGKTIAMPLPQLNWETKEDAMKAVDELKEILTTAKPTEGKAK